MASSLIKRGFSLVLIKTPLVTCLTTYSYQYYCGKYIIWYQTATSLFSLNPSFKTSYFSLLLIDSTFLRNRNVRPPKVRRYWNLIFDFYEDKKTVYIIMYRYKITNKENVDLLNQGYIKSKSPNYIFESYNHIIRSSIDNILSISIHWP